MRLTEKWSKRIVVILLFVAMLLNSLTACGKGEDWRVREKQVIDDNYRTWYEIFVYSFYDSDGDRIGDLQGVISKLDYVEELGFNGIWLMPIMPSPSYHKYDVTDYKAIDPQYGTMEDFEKLVQECDKRGIKLIVDLVLNHTSSEHPWFTAACEDAGIRKFKVEETVNTAGVILRVHIHAIPAFAYLLPYLLSGGEHGVLL